MDDPIAYFLTWPTYGTWLPGDARGWIEFKQGWRMPSSQRELEARARLKEDACVLSPSQQAIVDAQVKETCGFRNWTLHAINVRSNHMHVVVGAFEVTPKKIRSDLKAWCTRRLKEKTNSIRENWWAERGSIRWVFDEKGLDRVVEYVNEAQDRKHLEQ